MNGEYAFGGGRGELAKRVYDRADKIARKHECVLVNVDLPGGGWRYWFAGPNLGEPFNREMARDVYADLRKAGLLDAEGHLQLKKRSRR